ncbi:hypothetical protein HWV62_27803 [Athelia sp. TMB]|nr:hypothetical protein HWV62_27803 [Athelia sp. TMB]
MPTHLGFSAWIVSGGRVLPEYLVAVDPKTNKVQCWIPGEAGETFMVCWRDQGGGIDSCAYILLDGFVAPGRFLFGSGMASREGVRNGPNTERPFMFSEVKETVPNLDVTNKDEGMITVKIKLVERFSHRENPLPVIPAPKYGRQAAGQLRFIFRYRSGDFLQAQGIMPEASEVSTPLILPQSPIPQEKLKPKRRPSAAKAQRLLVTPSPTPSPKSQKLTLERLSPGMKKAFYPGMAHIGRLRPKDAPRTVSSRVMDQQTYAGLISFDEAGTGHSTIFVTEEPVEPVQEPGGQESILSPGRTDTPGPATKESAEFASQRSNHYARLAIPGQFSILECTNPDLSPNGQLPFISHLHHTVSSLSSIVKYISSRHPTELSPTPNLDVFLNASQKSQHFAWCAHVESNLGDLLDHMFYSLDINWFQLMLPTLANLMPLPQRYFVPARIRESHRPRLEAVELWNLPGIEQEEAEKSRWFGEKPKSPPEGEPREKFKRAFEREKVLDKAKSSLDIYTRLLGEKQFIFGEKPTTLDVHLASHLLLLMDTPFPDPLLQTLLKDSYPDLCDHARRIHLLALPATGSNISKLAAQNYGLRSLIPVWPTKFVRKAAPKNNKANPEDARFERMKWGWIALAAISTVVYIAQSGIVQAVRRASARVEFTQEDARDMVLQLNGETEAE